MAFASDRSEKWVFTWTDGHNASGPKGTDLWLQLLPTNFINRALVKCRSMQECPILLVLGIRRPECQALTTFEESYKWGKHVSKEKCPMLSRWKCVTRDVRPCREPRFVVLVQLKSTIAGPRPTDQNPHRRKTLIYKTYPCSESDLNPVSETFIGFNQTPFIT